MRLTIEDIVKATGGQCLNSAKVGNTIIQTITIDSRIAKEGCLFVPIKGERFDGHDYLEGISKQGVRVALTHKDEVADDRLLLIKVGDTRKALLDLANYYRKLFKIPFIAVTGSVGKTTTKELIASVLSEKYNVHKTAGNFNNDIGLPLTLFNLEEEHEVSIVEMGMNHFNEIEVLSLCAEPDFAVITNIGVSHIENLGSREGILKAKLEITEGLSKQGKLIINGDDDQLQKVERDEHVITYGMGKDNLYMATDIELEATRVKANVHTPKEMYTMEVNSPGEHMVYNALVAISLAEALGLTKEQILRGLAKYQAGKMRMHIESENGITVIDDTYNASTDSMKAAINVLSNMKVQGKKIAVLGDMFEMGEHAKEQHEEVGAYAGYQNIDVLCTVGELSVHMAKAASQNENIQVKHYQTHQQFIDEIPMLIHKGDAVLFKASRGMQLEKLAEEVRKVK